MTDIEKEFHYDVRSKKQLAASSRHKKNGSRSKKCTLTTDMLTNKQLRERNGDTIVYNLTKPMKWSDFKRLPDHAQEEYLSFLCDTFGTTATDIAKMFGVIASTVLKHIASKNLDIQFQRGHRMSRSKKENWDRFLMPESVDMRPPVVSEPVVCEATSAPAEAVDDDVKSSTKSDVPNLVLKSDEIHMSEITLRFDGIIDVNNIANTLRAVLGSQSHGKLFIGYRRDGFAEGGVA